MGGRPPVCWPPQSDTSAPLHLCSPGPCAPCLHASPACPNCTPALPTKHTPLSPRTHTLPNPTTRLSCPLSAPCAQAVIRELKVMVLGRTPSWGMRPNSWSASCHSPAFSHALMSALYVITERSHPLRTICWNTSMTYKTWCTPRQHLRTCARARMCMVMYNWDVCTRSPRHQEMRVCSWNSRSFLCIQRSASAACLQKLSV